MTSIRRKTAPLAAVFASLMVLALAPADAQEAGGAVRAAPSLPAATTHCRFSLLCDGRERIRLSNAPSDSRTGGTPQTSARTPGGPPDDANGGLTFELPSAHVFH